MHDDARVALAAALEAGGLSAFARSWYRSALFKTLDAHPRWRDGTIAARRLGGDEAALSAALSALSPGRQPPVTGPDLAGIHARGVGLMLIAGAEDAKFAGLAKEMAAAAAAGAKSGARRSAPEVVTVAGAGHAVHLEAPEALVLPLLRFLRREDEAR